MERQLMVEYGSRLIQLAALAVAVLSCTGCSREVTFSPDGRQVAFSWLSGAGQPLLLVAAADGSEVDVLPGSANGFSPRWAPNGSRILYAALTHDADTTRMEGRLFNFNSQSVAKVADGLGPPFAWREDSKRCAGILRRGETLEAYLYNVQDMGLFIDVPLPCKEVSLDNSDMVWVPDTDNIAIVGDSNVYLTDVNQLRTLTTTGDVVGIGRAPGLLSLNYARWMKDTNGASLALYNYDLHTATPTRLTSADWFHNPAAKLPGIVDQVLHVTFSPDGQRLAVRLRFHSAGKDGKLTGPAFEAIVAVGLDGTDPRLIQKGLVPASGAQSLEPRIESETLTASWSQDSKQLAVQENGPATSIHLYNANGSAGEKLALP